MIKEELKLIIQPTGAPGEPLEEPAIVVKVKKETLPIKITIKEPLRVYLNLRRALSGDYMIFDHPLYDIAILKDKNKILTFPKPDIQIDSYPSQNKFFNYLKRKGIIVPDTIQGGNIYGSLEAAYPINKDLNTVEILLFVIYHFFKDEIKDINIALHYDDEVEAGFYEPSEKDSTELGEVPHATKKGSIDPGTRPYGLIYRL